MKKILALCLLLLSVAGSAFAALPVAVSGAFTSLDTLITDLETAAWPVIIAVLVAFGTIALVKKFWRKAL